MGIPNTGGTQRRRRLLDHYLMLAFVLAYPALMAELLIGRHTPEHGHPRVLGEGEPLRSFGRFTGIGGLVRPVSC